MLSCTSVPAHAVLHYESPANARARVAQEKPGLSHRMAGELLPYQLSPAVSRGGSQPRGLVYAAGHTGFGYQKTLLK